MSARSSPCRCSRPPSRRTSRRARPSTSRRPRATPRSRRSWTSWRRRWRRATASRSPSRASRTATRSTAPSARARSPRRSTSTSSGSARCSRPTPTSRRRRRPRLPLGLRPLGDKYADVSEIPDGGTISLYSDPANEAQGLWLLQSAGLITLKEGTEPGTATQDDIASNPKNLQFTLLDFAAQSRALPDLDAAVGYTEYYLAADIPIEKQIFAPQAPDDFAGQLTIGSKYKDTANIEKLVAAFQDPAVQEFLATDETVKGILLPIEG